MKKLGLLQQAISQTKKEKEVLLSSSDTSSSTEENKKKWKRKGEIEQIKEKKYIEELEQKKRKIENNQQPIEQKEQESNNTENKEIIKDDNIPTIEVMKLLRNYGEPITLFGETHEMRLKRLENIQNIRGEFKGQLNDFARALKEREREVVNEKIKDKKKKKKFKGVPIKKDSQDSSEYVLKVLKRLMSEWQMKIDDQPDEIKKSSEGKIDATIFKQTKTYIKPLFKLLKKKLLADEILIHLENICKYLSQQEYVKANDVYYQLSIGNQPWPLGVTMVGIHARTARERIGTDKIKHILNDEEQRRYIQSVKRLITFCQNQYPTIPSKMFNYN
ncbi:hypothetical protein ABK040_013801 [Willaertia magna]